MEWTDDNLNALAKLNVEAASFIRSVVKSPYYESYLAILTMMNKFNIEMQGDEISLLNKTTVTEEGKVVDNSFPNVHKYATEIQSYHEQLEYLRLKLLPEEIERAEAKGIDILDQARLNLRKRGKEKV